MFSSQNGPTANSSDLGVMIGLKQATFLPALFSEVFIAEDFGFAAALVSLGCNSGIVHF